MIQHVIHRLQHFRLESLHEPHLRQCVYNILEFDKDFVSGLFLVYHQGYIFEYQISIVNHNRLVDIKIAPIQFI